ncbi:protein of unknown function [Xenorhabdus doucetiae]|uniref:Uncharacterized protein n=1 Tax=Xenorhabdus doucetiae TaxID=351671 RepID=A0A068QS73_9GAMM|nr:protein of unknown function [Xenorhabdus doucetiae]
MINNPTAATFFLLPEAGRKRFLNMQSANKNRKAIAKRIVKMAKEEL